jgi:hypothetical protein
MDTKVQKKVVYNYALYLIGKILVLFTVRGSVNLRA